MLTSKPPCWDKTTECALASVCVLITLLRKLVTGYLECDSPSTALTFSCSSLSRSSWSSLSSSFRCSASRTCLSRSSSFCLSTSFVARVCLAQIHKLNHSLHHIDKQESADTCFKKANPILFAAILFSVAMAVVILGWIQQLLLHLFLLRKNNLVSYTHMWVSGRPLARGSQPLLNMPFVLTKRLKEG